MSKTVVAVIRPPWCAATQLNAHFRNIAMLWLQLMTHPILPCPRLAGLLACRRGEQVDSTSHPELRGRARPCSNVSRRARWRRLVAVLFASVALFRSAQVVAASTDVQEFTDEAHVTSTLLPSWHGMTVRVLVKTEHDKWIHFRTQITVQWQARAIHGEQILFEGLSFGVETERGDGTAVRVQFASDARTDSLGSYRLRSWRWDARQQLFVEMTPVSYDPWPGKKQHLATILASGQIQTAWRYAEAMGASPNPCCGDETDELYLLFVRAVHRRATVLYCSDRRREAAKLVTQLITEPPYRDWPPSQGDAQWFSIDNHWLHHTDVPTRLLSRISATPTNIRLVNDLAFLLLEGNNAVLATSLLEQVVAHAPERLVAWLNLADARWDQRDNDSDEGATQAYVQYIEGMTIQGRQSAILPRVWRRALM